MTSDSDETLRRRVRAQGNFIEYVPTALVALALVEAQATPDWLVMAIGASLAAGRLLHAVGMLRGSTPLRGAGMVLTYVSLLTSALTLIVQTLA